MSGGIQTDVIGVGVEEGVGVWRGGGTLSRKWTGSKG